MMETLVGMVRVSPSSEKSSEAEPVSKTRSLVVVCRKSQSRVLAQRDLSVSRIEADSREGMLP